MYCLTTRFSHNHFLGTMASQLTKTARAYFPFEQEVKYMHTVNAILMHRNSGKLPSKIMFGTLAKHQPHQRKSENMTDKIVNFLISSSQSE
jgi:hypothetical protein